MEFSKPVYGITFDMEIFPDVTSNVIPPDFTFKAYASDGKELTSVQTFGKVPDPSLRSPATPGGPEPYMQLLAFGQTYSFPNGATKLEFIDWPPTIGIDNLDFQLEPPTTVPEPATMLLFLGSLAGAGLYGRSRRGKTAVTNGDNR
jgi:hypothetical protein